MLEVDGGRARLGPIVVRSKDIPAHATARPAAAITARMEQSHTSAGERWTELRHALHRAAELSGAESRTAGLVAERLGAMGPTALHTGLGGHGVAAEFAGGTPGRAVLLRAELDALPIPEPAGPPYRSRDPGVSHRCGHDGHMTMVLAAAERVLGSPGFAGRLVLLFQPAEETGAGARGVVADPRWARLRPDCALALHNLPGVPMGRVVCRPGPMHCSSAGLTCAWSGVATHAATPELGRSPAGAMAALIGAATGVNAGDTVGGVRPQRGWLATVVGARLGAEGPVAFGMSPAEGRVDITARAHTDDGLDALLGLLKRVAVEASGGLEPAFTEHDRFDATVNHPEAVGVAQLAALRCGLATHEPDEPIRWSEDFGVICRQCPGAMIGLGAGVSHPPLHSSEYDFPDALIPVGAGLLAEAALRACAGG
ncbi:MAG: amidohydrolase [Planctomyces sp.]|nr:amidohydrolase [Planctomyces sp.]